jgi:hypothetical protein
VIAFMGAIHQLAEHLQLVEHLPSPLAGEGVTVARNAQLGEGDSSESALLRNGPSPILRIRKFVMPSPARGEGKIPHSRALGSMRLL